MTAITNESFPRKPDNPMDWTRRRPGYRHGWIAIPDVQTGDRTLEEQMNGVREALPEASGKTVLDLGCAEGLIGREFAKAGAARVHGYDSIREHLAVARGQCRGLAMRFELGDFNKMSKDAPAVHYDIVLALGVCHKLGNPEDGVRYAARSGKETALVLIRMHAHGEAAKGYMRSKFNKEAVCHVNGVMESEGYRLEKILPGPREETVQWWRRAAS